MKKSKTRTALGVVFHELVNHISTAFWLLGRFTVKTHLAKGVIMSHLSSVIMIYPKASTGLLKAFPEHSPNLLQTSPEPAQRIPNHSSTLSMHPSSHTSFLHHCSFLPYLPAPSKFPQRDCREHTNLLPGSLTCASNKLKSVH